MRRTKISDRPFPKYTLGEEIFNTVSHIIGGVFGIFVLVSCVSVAMHKNNVWGIVGGAIYGAAMILLYTTSSVYHGLRKNKGKKIMQILDHCMIYLLIGGTYTPILLSAVRKVSPVWAWTLFGMVWGLSVMGATFTAIDLKKYSKLSMGCYIGIGWCVVIAIKPLIQALPLVSIGWIVAGGVAYTIGAVLYGIGSKRSYMHSVFHVFVVLGSILQYIGIIIYVF